MEQKGHDIKLAGLRPVELKTGNLTKIFQVKPWPNNIFYTLPTLKEFADDNSKFDDNGEKFSERIENTMGKGEIACYRQFLLFPQISKN